MKSDKVNKDGETPRAHLDGCELGCTGKKAWRKEARLKVYESKENKEKIIVGWTEERVAKLTTLWEEGLSTSEIGKRLQVSKNSVIGKAHRMNLKARPSPIRRNPDSSQKQKLRSQKAAFAKDQKNKINNEIVNLKDTHDEWARPRAMPRSACRWPIGDPENPDFHFCRAKVVSGRPYCANHCAIAYLPRGRSGKSAVA